MPKSKTVDSLMGYEKKLDAFAKAKSLEKRLRDKAKKIK